MNEVTTSQERTDFGILLILREPDDVALAVAQLLDGRAIDHPVGLVRRRHFDFRGQTLRRAYVWAANLPEPAAAAPAA